MAGEPAASLRRAAVVGAAIAAGALLYYVMRPSHQDDSPPRATAALANSADDATSAPEITSAPATSADVVDADTRCANLIDDGEKAEIAAYSRSACSRENQRKIAREMASCTTQGANVVGFRVGAVSVEGGYDDQTCVAHARIDLVRIDGTGHVDSVVVGEAAPLENGGSGKFNFESINGWAWNVNGPPVYFDFDGDGEPEVLVAGIPTGEGADESEGSEWHQAWTFRNGAWKKYPPLAKAHFESVADVDNDDRPDLRTRGPYEPFLRISGMAGSQGRIFQPIFILHSLPNGAFSVNDEVAKNAVRKACSTAKPLEERGDAGAWNELDALAIACARMRGQSEAEVMEPLDRMCAEYTDEITEQESDHCPTWAKQIATTKPPFVLK